MFPALFLFQFGVRWNPWDPHRRRHGPRESCLLAQCRNKHRPAAAADAADAPDVCWRRRRRCNGMNAQTHKQTHTNSTLHTFMIFFLRSDSSPCRPRLQRCGSSLSWTSWTPWASSTAKPTCRLSSPLEETSTPLSRDCWAHSPHKDIHTDIHTDTCIPTYIHTYIHAYIFINTQASTENQEKLKWIVPNLAEETWAGCVRP